MAALPLPAFIQIEPVGRCNLRCQMCPIQFRKDAPPAQMAFDFFTRIIDQLPHLQELHLQGLGEPMMHPRFFDMVAYGVEKGVRVTTSSNLTLLSSQRAQRLVISGLDRLYVSVDGATAETYERIRVRSRFLRVEHNVHLLIEARERLRSNHPQLAMTVVIMRQNLHELPDLVRLAHCWSINEIFVQHLAHDFAESSLPDEYRDMRRFVQAQTLLEDDGQRIDHYFGVARDVAVKLSINLRLPRTRPKPYPMGAPGRARCDWPWRSAYISYQGYAMPCCMVATPDRASLGNVVENSVDAVWRGDAFQTFRKQLDSDQPPEICRGCSAYTGTF